MENKKWDLNTACSVLENLVKKSKDNNSIEELPPEVLENAPIEFTEAYGDMGLERWNDFALAFCDVLCKSSIEDFEVVVHALTSIMFELIEIDIKKNKLRYIGKDGKEYLDSETLREADNIYRDIEFAHTIKMKR